jgi:hypothetical protein
MRQSVSHSFVVSAYTTVIRTNQFTQIEYFLNATKRVNVFCTFSKDRDLTERDLDRSWFRQSKRNCPSGRDKRLAKLRGCKGRPDVFTAPRCAFRSLNFPPEIHNPCASCLLTIIFALPTGLFFSFRCNVPTHVDTWAIARIQRCAKVSHAYYALLLRMYRFSFASTFKVRKRRKEARDR